MANGWTSGWILEYWNWMRLPSLLPLPAFKSVYQFFRLKEFIESLLYRLIILCVRHWCDYGILALLCRSLALSLSSLFRYCLHAIQQAIISWINIQSECLMLTYKTATKLGDNSLKRKQKKNNQPTNQLQKNENKWSMQKERPLQFLLK